MAGIKYDKIFQDLKEKIEERVYPAQTFLPSEHMLTEQYGCSRNTVRRAIVQLAEDGYVQSVHGKGVQIIFDAGMEESSFMLGGIESLEEAVARNRRSARTKVVCFCELEVDDKIHARTSFPVGTPIYYIQRVRYIDGQALIIDHNYFDRTVVRDLTPEIAETSIYRYLEERLRINIVTTRRKMTVEKITQLDDKYLELGDYNCMAVVSSVTYDDSGKMFEYTQSRHRPDKFVFYNIARRNS